MIGLWCVVPISIIIAWGMIGIILWYDSRHQMKLILWLDIWIRKIEDYSDRVLYRVLDKVLGKGEEIRIDNAKGKQESE